MKRRRQRYSVNGRRLFVTLVVVALALVLVFRHKVERALGLRTGHIVSTLGGGGRAHGHTTTGGTTPTKGKGGKSGGGVSVSGNTAKGQGTGQGSSPKTSGGGTGGSQGASAGKGAGGSTAGGGTSGSGSGSGSQASAPPPTSYPGAPTITAFYADLGAGKTAQAYALLAPGLAAQTTPNAFAQTYATVKSAQVQDLSLQGAGNFTRTFAVTVAFTLTSGTIETKNGTVTVQDQSGGVGKPDWAISALGLAP